MAWQDDMLTILRVLINDTDCGSPEYSDDRLFNVLIVAAHYVVDEISFDNDYTVDISARTISPTPDASFINLVVLKAACIIDKGNMRLAAMSAGIEARCGPATMRTLRRMDGFKILLDNGYCAAYEHAKLEHKMGRSIEAILSPFINSDFDPSHYNYNNYNYFRS